MRILHTSDWHLGRTLEGHSRIPEQREFLEELCVILERESVNLVLIAGDIFDTPNPSAEAENLFYEALDRLSKRGERAVVVIAGNHDSPDRLRAANPLAHKQGIFLLGYPGEGEEVCQPATLTGEGEVAAAQQTMVFMEVNDEKNVCKVAGGSGWLELAIPGCQEHALIAALPYPSEHRLNEVLSKTLEEKDMQKAYSERVGIALREGAASFRSDTVNLAVSHLYVLGGCSSESEREIQLGGAYVVEPQAMPDKAHYIALGHLHRPQKVGGTIAPCRYSGSPLCYSFSEADQQKEVVLVEALPGKEAQIKSIKLMSGKPMYQKRFASYQEALAWCQAEENLNAWVHMEIETTEPLTNTQVEQLNKAHPGIIFCRVILPGVESDDQEGQRLSELSLSERFARFVARETGALPDEELVNLFLELVNGGGEDETR